MSTTGAMRRGGHNVIKPALEDLMPKVDSRYTLVVMTARRARQVMNAYQKRGDSFAEKPVTRAMKEIAAGQVGYVRVSPDETATPDEAES